MSGRPQDEDGHYEVLCARDRTYEMSDLWEQLTVAECITLAKKPKIFIIEVHYLSRIRSKKQCANIFFKYLILQGDRGTRVNKLLHGDSNRNSTVSTRPGVESEDGCFDFMKSCSGNGSSKKMARIPRVSDFLFAYGTMPHFQSYLDPVLGSAFIQSLCRSLNEASEGQDLLQILTSTTNKVVSQGFQQCPYVISITLG